MALIGMAVYCTEENGKDEYLERTLHSLSETVDFSKHRLQLSVNAYTDRTVEIIDNFSIYRYSKSFKIIEKVIKNDENIGTAEAINKVWQDRKPGEHCVKMDDDVVIKNGGWLDDMEEVVRRNIKIGQVGLKRKDLIESPSNQDEHYRSKLVMLPHKPGERWIVVEQCNHIMGTCVLHSSRLLDRIGYLWQIGKYGFDDAFMSLRSALGGFANVFIPSVEIDHIDNGGTPYQTWKEEQAGKEMPMYDHWVSEFRTGKRDIYYNPFI